ncbi:MAG: hypothetical protein J1D87_07990 [Lachnospiraceae bacterium]|nr:hypothetical protein [Lachnospiraceae bacterium]
MSLTKRDLQAIADLFDEKFDEKFDKKFDEKFDQKFDEKFDQKFEEKFAPINERLDRIELRLDKVESEVSAVKSNQIDMRKELKIIDVKVSDTYQLALDAWGTSAENRHLIGKAN